MLNLLDACIQLDTRAAQLYQSFARGTTDDSLRELFDALHAEETERLTWWRDIARRIDAGEVSQIGEYAEITSYLQAILCTLDLVVDAGPDALSDDERLALAASLEYFALDPVFAWMVSASDEAHGDDRRAAYGDHVSLLIAAMERRGSWALAPHVTKLKASLGEIGSADSGHHGPETLLPSRELAEQALDELCSDPARDHEAISLGLVDLPVAGLGDLDGPLAKSALTDVVGALVSLVRFSDLLVSLGGARFAVVMPATNGPAACGLVVALSEAAASVVEAAAHGSAVVGATAAVVTLPPVVERCSGFAAFEEAEALLGETREARQPLGVRELV